MLFTVEKEKLALDLYKRLKGTPMEEYYHRIMYSVHRMYEKRDQYFWIALNLDSVRDSRINQRRARIRRYVRGMIDTFEDQVYLLSLTFTDKSLALLSEKTRQRYVREYLQANTLDYYACIDFGKKTDREHYHAIVAVSDDSLGTFRNPKNNKLYLCMTSPWEYGFHSLKKIFVSRKDLVKTCAYVFKASNYAFKNADSDHRPFHKRGVEHIKVVRDDFDLALFERALERPFLDRLHTPSGFEGETAKKSYSSPYVWFGDALTCLTSYGAVGGDDGQSRLLLSQ